MIALYMAVNVLSGLLVISGIGGVPFCIYYLFNNGDMTWLFAALLLFSMWFISAKINKFTEIYIKNKHVRDLIYSMMKSSGGIFAYRTFWFLSVVPLLSVFLLFILYIAEHPILVLLVGNLLALFSFGMLRIAARGEDMVWEALSKNDAEV